MGTEIELTVSGVSLDYAKNHMGNDWGFLFQEGDLTRRRTEAINYDYYAEHPEEADELKVVEETLIRPLAKVLSRLNILGHTLETARAEYQAVISGFDAFDEGSGDEGGDKRDSMTFEKFCSIANRFPLDELSGAYVEFETPDRDVVAQGRFAALADEFSRIPWNGSQNMYWSEKSYLSDKVCILSAGSMLQVFGLNPANLTAEVEWAFGPIVHAGWIEREAIKVGATRVQSVLVATEGASDARILRKALDAFRPDVSDFFRFIDGGERHHFWGTGNLLRFAEGLIRIDIQNRVLFLLDNDAEGADAFRKLQQMKMPGNLRSMALPNIEELRSFPALGPQGLALCDINGRAAAIECYLDLNLSDYPAARIIWSNYKREIDTWHGALEHKDSYTDHFMTQDIGTLVRGGYDSSKLVQLLDALIAEASRLLPAN